MAFIRIHHKSLPDDGVLLGAPTLARYFGLGRQKEIKDWTPVFESENAIREIEKRRSMKLTFPEYARVYSRVAENSFVMDPPGYPRNEPDGSQVLFRKSDRVNLSNELIPKKYRPEPLPDFFGATETDADGYEVGFPFKARARADHYLDAVYKASGGKSISFEIPRDLSMIRLVPEAQKAIVLVPSNDERGASAVLYRSANPGSGYRGVIVYADSDIGRMERIFIETPEKLFEFVACVPGKVCIR
jgi:hypothetical protein